MTIIRSAYHLNTRSVRLAHTRTENQSLKMIQAKAIVRCIREKAAYKSLMACILTVLSAIFTRVILMGAQLVINKDNTQTWLDHFKSATSQALDEIGMIAEGYAKRKCPVDTSNLVNSITNQVDYTGKKVYIGTNVEYAPYVEMGTSKQTAQPYLRPAAQEHGSTYKAILKMHLQNG